MICIGLFIHTSNAHAIYSPTIAQRVSQIRQHVLAARQQNGTGTLTSAAQHLIENDRIQRAKGGATGFPAKAAIALGQVMGDLFAWAIPDSIDSMFMIFEIVPSTQEYISTCLRDDIWLLEDLKNIVAQEMVKSYLMADETNGDLLSDDYDYLMKHIRILKQYGNHPTAWMKVTTEKDGRIIVESKTSSQYLFGSDTTVNPYSFQFPVEEVDSKSAENCKITCKQGCKKVVYCDSSCVTGCGQVCEGVCKGKKDCEGRCKDKCEDSCENDCDMATECEDDCDDGCEESAKLRWAGCPEGDFMPALNEVMEALRNLKTIGSWQAADWGSILEMAKARARKRADEWIKANQLTLTLGGETGGNPQSLVKGGGWDRFVGSVNTQLNILKNMVGPVIPMFTWAFVETIGETVSLIWNDPEILQDNACMYFYADENTYRACTLDQYLDYLSCRNNEKAAKKDKINCDLFKNPRANRVAVDIIEEQQETVAEHRNTIKRAETVFFYNLELKSVSENSIEGLSQVLIDINSQIKRGFEVGGSKDDKALPTLYYKLSQWDKKHGPNKK